MRQVIFHPDALEELDSFRNGQQRLTAKVIELIIDIQKTPFTGKGKPELLKHNKSGFWSRRISDEHRLIYKVSQESIEIINCKGHYTE